ncbi:MAG: hypothetical protein U0412_11125 [Nitrospira sp.]
MTEQEMNRAIQYVTASTSYGRETVAGIVTAGLGELADYAQHGTRRFDRDVLMEYVCQWTIKKTGQPEPLVREVLGCAGRWLDEVYEEIAKQEAEQENDAPADDEGAEPV